MSDSQLVVVRTFATRLEAEVAQGALEAADIQSMISADDAGGYLWTAGVRLLVRAEEMHQASEILAQSKSS